MMKPVVKTAIFSSVQREKETGKKLNHLTEARELFICFVGF
jgi:hypothetical protein